MQWVDLDAALERVAGHFELLAEERGVAVQRSVRTTAGAGARV